MPEVAEVTHSIFTITRSLCVLLKSAVYLTVLAACRFSLFKSIQTFPVQCHFHHTIYLPKKRHQIVTNCVKIKFKLQNMPFKMRQSVHNHLSSIPVTTLPKQPCNLDKLFSDRSMCIHTSTVYLPHSSHYSSPYHSFFPQVFPTNFFWFFLPYGVASSSYLDNMYSQR